MAARYADSRWQVATRESPYLFKIRNFSFLFLFFALFFSCTVLGRDLNNNFFLLLLLVSLEVGLVRVSQV